MICDDDSFIVVPGTAMVVVGHYTERHIRSKLFVFLGKVIRFPWAWMTVVYSIVDNTMIDDGTADGGDGICAPR